jgi:transposase
MLDEGTRRAVLAMREKGMGARTIARAMKLSRGAVREVLRAGTPAVPRAERGEKAEPYDADIRELHGRCKGNLVRVHEELQLRGATLSYQALTGYCRRHGIGYEPPKPAGRYVFEPGEEMQHDTSPHLVSIGGVERRVQTASVVLAYSRMRYLQLYPSFNRFTCKVFLDEAVSFFGGACRRCMVDNTHVIVLSGTGATMVPVPEMEAFGKRYGFTFVAHEKGHANRSAHVERGFDHFERNFLAGRTFTARSGPRRSRIPAHADHPFRRKPITDSGACRSLNGRSCRTGRT